ncbi:MAG: o-succinylbenzoate--CoA ligase, partial [Calditrichia bacterium]
LLPHRELQISRDGEIMVRGKKLFKGYLQGVSVEQPLQNGWFPSGDSGFLDEQGYLHVTGRRDNLIISGGENIQPEEIEYHLLKMKEIEQAVVVSVPHPEYGQRPAAFIKYSESRPIAAGILRRRLKRELPDFKIPDHFFQWPDIETAGLKISRPHLQKIALDLIYKLNRDPDQS